jgi:DNA-binding IclR family transcriptional regulator
MSQSAERMLVLLQAVVRSERPIGLMEVADATGIDKSTAMRLLGSLVNRGFLQRHTITRQYSVGPALVSLGAAAMKRMDIVRAARGQMEAIFHETTESVTLHVPVGLDRVCVDGIESTHALRRGVSLGEILPIYAGPTGKVMLAHLPAPDRDKAFARADADGLDTARLRELTTMAGRQGYLSLIGDRTPGVGAISVPIFGYGGIAGALSVAGPEERWGLERMAAYAPHMLAAAHSISAMIGGASEAAAALPSPARQ